ncbi:MAG: diguanylate cyclase [Rhizobiaceae bacterium]
MSGASVILFVNLMVGGLLAAFFLVLALYDRRLVSARWFAGAYGFGVAYIIGEFVIAFLDHTAVMSIMSSSSMIAGLALLNIGLASRYKVRPPFLLLGLGFLLSVGVFIVTSSMPRESMLRNFLYQSPFFAMQSVGVWIVLAGRSRKLIDLALASFLGMTSLHYMSKPFASVLLGGPGATPQDYIATAYAMFSQSMGTVFVLATALILMALLVSDMLRDVTWRSITDPLSGLFNRRGFEGKLAEMLAKRGPDGPPLSLVYIDLDRFKSINDTFGHAAGDRVIEAFADILREASAGLHVIGRVGGEEYAVALSHCNAPTAQLFAESVRAAFGETQVEGFPAGQRFSASFGVATLEGAETPSALMERADAALYEAKRAGRNCVRLAPAPSGLSAPLRVVA